MIQAYLAMIANRRADAKKRKSAAAAAKSPLVPVRPSVGVFNALEQTGGGGGGAPADVSAPATPSSPGTPTFAVMRAPSDGDAEGMHNLRTVKEL
jgi:hypothetical protein